MKVDYTHNLITLNRSLNVTLTMDIKFVPRKRKYKHKPPWPVSHTVSCPFHTM